VSRDDQSRLDDALEQTFPASDPPAFGTAGAGPAADAPPSTADPGRRASLDGLLRGEIAAVETYTIALGRLAGDSEQRRQLLVILHGHQEARAALAADLQRLGARPTASSGLFGACARLLQRVANLFGTTAALRTLRAGEVHGLRRYRRARDWRPLPATVQQRIGGRAIPRQQGHIDALDAMLAAG
jgi:hypothetical protein